MKKTFKTLKEILEACDNQITAQQLLNGRLSLKGKGWTSVNIAPELMAQTVDKIVSTCGGREKTKNIIRNKLLNSKPQHRGLSRFYVESYKQVNNGEPYLSYCAFQDQTTEIKELRMFLAKG